MDNVENKYCFKYNWFKYVGVRKGKSERELSAGILKVTHENNVGTYISASASKLT